MADAQDVFLDAGVDDDALLLTALLEPLDGTDAALALPLASAAQTLPAPLVEQRSDSVVNAAVPRDMPSSIAISLGAAHNTLDEVLLLAETEALFTILEPVPASGMEPRIPEAPVIKPKNTAPFTVGHNNAHLLALESADSTQHMPARAAETACTSQRGRKRGSKPGSMRNPSRERLQNELEYLRKQVVVLEHDLEQKRANASPSASPGSDYSVDDAAMTMASNWERIAKRQRQNCERAVSENKRLRGMLALQKELVAGMEATLYSWQHVAQQTELLTAGSGDSTTWTGPSVDKNVHLEPGDDLIFEQLVSELDTTYAQMDAMFRDAGLDELGTESLLRSTLKTYTTRDGSVRSFFEVIEVDVSPFDFELTNRVARICYEFQSQMPDCVVFESDWTADGVVTEKYRVKRVLGGKDVYLYMLMALKEHVFEDRVVLVWRNAFRCDAHFPDAYVLETGAFVATPLGSTGTLTKMCAHLEPKRSAPTAETLVRADTDKLTTLVMDSYHDDLQEVNDMMESMLLEESRKRS